MGRIIKEGELIKSPPESKQKNASSWHQRYFVLVEINEDENIPISKRKETADFNKNKVFFYLMYWNSNDARKNRGKPKGIIPVSSACVVTKSDIETFPHTVEKLIKLKTPSRTFILSASTKELQDEWYSCLYTSICNGTISPVSNPLYVKISDIGFGGDDDSIFSWTSDETDDDSGSYTSNQRSPLSGVQEEPYEDMSSYSKLPRAQSLDDSNQTRQSVSSKFKQRPLSMMNLQRSFSNSSNESDIGIRSLQNDFKEITFYDVKIIVPSSATLSLTQDNVEVHTEKSFCKIEKDITHNTKL